MTPNRHLVIFVKAPRLGRVKSRLAREIGAVEATRCYRVLAARAIRRLARDTRWRTSLWIAPDSAARAPTVWPPNLKRFGQGGGDLGSRMARPFRKLPPGPAVLVGTDVPDLGLAEVARAFALLGRHAAVFGPALDGGFWLVGLRRRPHLVLPFAGVRWSTVHALLDTIANMGEAKVALLDALGDVDVAEDYRRWLKREG